jgi:hypothetical protein
MLSRSRILSLFHLVHIGYGVEYQVLLLDSRDRGLRPTAHCVKWRTKPPGYAGGGGEDLSFTELGTFCTHIFKIIFAIFFSRSD